MHSLSLANYASEIVDRLFYREKYYSIYSSMARIIKSYKIPK